MSNKINIDFSQPKVSNNGPAAEEGTENDNSLAVNSLAVPLTAEERKAFVTGLHNLFPKAALLGVFLPKENLDCRPTTKKLPRTIMSLYHPRYQKLSPSMLPSPVGYDPLINLL